MILVQHTYLNQSEKILILYDYLLMIENWINLELSNMFWLYVLRRVENLILQGRQNQKGDNDHL